MANVFKSEEKEIKKRIIEIVEKYLLENCDIEYLYDNSLLDVLYKKPLINRVTPIGIRIKMDLAIANEKKKEGE